MDQSPAADRPPTALAALAPLAVEVPEDERARFLGLARVAVAVAAGARPGADLDAALDAAPLPDRCAGAFVTLTEGGELRGCVGSLDAETPAWSSVTDAARWATRSDPRFPGVRASELPRLHLEVSILGPLVRLADPGVFRPGIDGVMIRRGGRRGLLLPEVADMLDPGPTAMLDAVCRKAGLPTQAWRYADTELWVFRTCRFGGAVVPDEVATVPVDAPG